MLARDLLRRYGACSEAIEWASDRTPEEAWADCPRGDLMLWWATLVAGPWGSESHRRVVAAAAECVRMVTACVPASETRPEQALATAERYGRGENVSRKDMRMAYHDAARAAAAFAAASLTDDDEVVLVAATAASVADAIADAVDGAPAYTATYAATAVATLVNDVDVREQYLAYFADLVRAYYPHPPMTDSLVVP